MGGVRLHRRGSRPRADAVGRRVISGPVVTVQAAGAAFEPGLLAAVRAALPCEVFVHAGCGPGDAIAVALPLFAEVYGVERSETRFAQCQLRHAQARHLTLTHDEPERFLREHASAFRPRPVWFLLDASSEASPEALLDAMGAPGPAWMITVAGLDDAPRARLGQHLSNRAPDYACSASNGLLLWHPTAVTGAVAAHIAATAGAATGASTNAAPPRPIAHRVARRIWRGVERVVRPRLSMVQYPPRPLAVPRPLPHSLPDEALPSLAVVTPSYNQGRYIERTIRSVVGQGYPRLSYVVQDGGSTDDTTAVLARWAPRLSAWESARDSGQANAVNRGFAAAQGEVMTWINSDDLSLPGTLRLVGELFARRPEVDVIYGNRLIIDGDDREIGRWMLPGHDDGLLSWADYVPQETLFWRRRIWEAAGGRVDEQFRYALDWDLLLRFRAAGARFLHLPRFLGAFRFHASQKSGIMTHDVGFAEMQRLRAAALGAVPTERQLFLRMLGVRLGSAGVGLRDDLRRALGRSGEMSLDEAMQMEQRRS